MCEVTRSESEELPDKTARSGCGISLGCVDAAPRRGQARGLWHGQAPNTGFGPTLGCGQIFISLSHPKSTCQRQQQTIAELRKTGMFSNFNFWGFSSVAEKAWVIVMICVNSEQRHLLRRTERNGNKMTGSFGK